MQHVHAYYCVPQSDVHPPEYPDEDNGTQKTTSNERTGQKGLVVISNIMICGLSVLAKADMRAQSPTYSHSC